MPNRMLNRALFATQAVCCRCEEAYYLLDTNIAGAQAGRISCSKCAHAPCAKCRYSGEALMRVPRNNDLSIRSPREEQQLHLRICCGCGLPADVAVKQVHRRGKLLSPVNRPPVYNVAGFSVQFRKHRCAGCEHKCCGACACFLEAEDFEGRGLLETEAGRQRRRSGMSISSLRSISKTVWRVVGATGSVIAAFTAGKVGETDLATSDVGARPGPEILQDISNLVPEFEVGFLPAKSAPCPVEKSPSTASGTMPSIHRSHAVRRPRGGT